MKNGVAGLLALGSLVMVGSSALALGPAPQPGKSVTVTVTEVVGTARMVTVEGVEDTVSAGTSVPKGATLMTDAGSRAALSFNAKSNPKTLDVLMLGPDSKVEVIANKATKEAPEYWAPVLAKVHRGSYRAFVRNTKAQFAVQTGDRVAYLDAADLAGSYAGGGDDDASYMVQGGDIVITAGKRRIKLAEGMLRKVEDGRVLGAKSFSESHWDDFTAGTTVPGVDLSRPQPKRITIKPNEQTREPDNITTIAKRDPSVNTDPKPYEYDAERDQFWDPEHNHWHSGRPPANAGQAAGEGNPIDWQYDAERDRYWNPDHGHWHSGRPPADAAKRAAATTPATTPGTTPGTTPATTPPPATGSGADPVYVLMRTSMGDITIELDASRAPISVANFLAYAEEGAYEGTIFHRVIPHFMIQGGGFTPDMQKKPTKDGIKNEWQNGLKNRRGTIAMARLGGQADSATSQFFINVVDNDSLDVPRDGAGYAVFGKVVQGLDVVDKIKSVKTGNVARYRDVPVEPVVIEKVTRTAAPK